MYAIGGYFMYVIFAAALFLTCSQQHVVDILAVSFCPILTNHTSMESMYIINVSKSNLTFKRLILMTGFVVQGHICW